jgi:hypothetical protein
MSHIDNNTSGFDLWFRTLDLRQLDQPAVEHGRLFPLEYPNLLRKGILRVILE